MRKKNYKKKYTRQKSFKWSNMSNFYPIWFKLGLEMISFTPPNKTDKYKCVSVRLSVSLSFCQFVSLSDWQCQFCQFVTLPICHCQFVTLSVRHSVSSSLIQCILLLHATLVNRPCLYMHYKIPEKTSNSFSTLGGDESKFEVNKLAKDVKDATLSMYDRYLRCIFSIACCKIVSKTIFRTNDEANRRIIKQWCIYPRFW